MTVENKRYCKNEQTSLSVKIKAIKQEEQQEDDEIEKQHVVEE